MSIFVCRTATFPDLFTSFPPPFQYLSTSKNRRKRLKTKGEMLNLFTLAGKEIYSVFLRGVISGGLLRYGT